MTPRHEDHELRAPAAAAVAPTAARTRASKVAQAGLLLMRAGLACCFGQAAAKRAEAEAEGLAWAEAEAGGGAAAAGSEVPAWEHATIEAVKEADIARYLN